MQEAVPALLEFYRTTGMNGVAVCGTNGEGSSLTVAERKAMLEAVIVHKGTLTVVAGTGASALPDALELTRHAAEVGADASLVIPPFFIKNPTPMGLANYFLPLLDCAKLPMLLYNIPQFSGVPISESLLEILNGHENLVGIKDSEGGRERTIALIQQHPELQIFCGSDPDVAAAYRAGAVGSISGTANPFPERCAAVWNAFLESPDTDSVEQAQSQLDIAIALLRKYPFVGFGKAVQANRGLPRMGVRPPLVPMTLQQEEEMVSEAKSLGLLSL